jgi:hypothetical protein
LNLQRIVVDNKVSSVVNDVHHYLQRGLNPAPANADAEAVVFRSIQDQAKNLLERSRDLSARLKVQAKLK